MYIKRTLVLSSLTNNNKCILNIEKTNPPKAYFKGDCKDYAVFAFGDAPLEMYQLTSLETKKECILPDYVDISGSIGCAVLNYDGDSVGVDMLGTTQNKEVFKADLNKSLNHFTTKIKALNNVKSPEIEELFDANEDEINDCIADTLLAECLEKDSTCEKCVYKNAFFDESKEESKQEELKVDAEPVFFDQVKNSIENLFETYPPNQELIDAIPNSQFVRVDYEGDGNFYSVGLLFDEENLKYICYAIPSVEGETPPKELQEFTQWLKIRDGYGYWMTYQDGKTGESVILN